MSTSAGALATAKEAMSVQRGLLTTVLPAGRFDQEQYRQFLGALAIEERALSTFRKHASREERAEYDRTVSGAGVEDASSSARSSSTGSPRGSPSTSSTARPGTTRAGGSTR